MLAMLRAIAADELEVAEADPLAAVAEPELLAVALALEEEPEDPEPDPPVAEAEDDAEELEAVESSVPVAFCEPHTSA